MPTGRPHQVMCVTCRTPAVTLYAYPERRCDVTVAITRDGARIRVSCTQPPGNEDCGLGVHYDEYLLARFGKPYTLRAARQGQTGRA
jgi:hypothetical protein